MEGRRCLRPPHRRRASSGPAKKCSPWLGHADDGVIEVHQDDHDTYVVRVRTDPRWCRYHRTSWPPSPRRNAEPEAHATLASSLRITSLSSRNRLTDSGNRTGISVVWSLRVPARAAMPLLGCVVARARSVGPPPPIRGTPGQFGYPCRVEPDVDPVRGPTSPASPSTVDHGVELTEVSPPPRTNESRKQRTEE